MEQRLISTTGELSELRQLLDSGMYNNVLLVCGKHTSSTLCVNDLILGKVTGSNITMFSDFKPNPTYESVVQGVKLFRENGCDSIVAIGGGSAIDVAKCIKLFTGLEGDGENGEFLKMELQPSDIPFAVMPTTAGTGSEATRFAVIYYNGVKQSVTHVSSIPNVVFLNPDALKSLPDYHRKSSMLDALAHSIESFWSVNSTEESRSYSCDAISMIMANMEEYLNNTPEGNRQMLIAANTAGKAINITQTTAGHAMCYKITSLFGLAHGHAAFLCDKILFPWMTERTDRCSDPRGSEYLKSVFEQISKALGCGSTEEAKEKLESIYKVLELDTPKADQEQINELTDSVNEQRLKNNPIALDKATIRQLYEQILEGVRQ